ncbi:hypothetical protein SM978_03870, partial [Escherichia coli]|nr:hypothetical protein [Escherichia coli]
FLVILFTSFSGSLVSRIPGAVQPITGGIFVCFQAYHLDAFFGRASSAAHTNDRGLTMVDLFCCTRATA